MPDLASIRADIERVRRNVARLRRDILGLQKRGLPTSVTERDLQTLLDRIDALCAERDRLRGEEVRPTRVLGGRSW